MVIYLHYWSLGSKLKMNSRLWTTLRHLFNSVLGVQFCNNISKGTAVAFPIHGNFNTCLQFKANRPFTPSTLKKQTIATRDHRTPRNYTAQVSGLEVLDLAIPQYVANHITRRRQLIKLQSFSIWTVFCPEYCVYVQMLADLILITQIDLE